MRPKTASKPGTSPRTPAGTTQQGPAERWRRPRRRAARALAAAVVLLALTAGCGTGHGPAGRTGPATPTSAVPTAGGGSGSGLSWIVSGQALTRMLALDSAAATRVFDSPTAYVLTGSGQWTVPSGWSSTPTADFTSYATLRRALTGRRLDPRIRAVLYDNEHWSLTPAAEQAHPAHYDQLAGQLAHQYHLLFLAAPATDLAGVLRPGTATGSTFDAMLGTGLFGQIAPTTDVLDVQGQGAEADPAKFAAFVSAAAAQAHAANPRLAVLAGISTNPSGQALDAAAIERAAQAVRAGVEGYWLNDPAAGTACPRCAGPFPDVALAVATTLTGR